MCKVLLASVPSPVSDGIHLGPVFVHVYGLMYVVGLAAAMALTRRLWVRRGGRRELVGEVVLWAFPAGLIGGRLYFVATSWNEVPRHWWGPVAVWEGGLGIWGGVALGTLVGVWRLRRAGVPVAAFMDVAAPGLLVAQAIGRIGNYFNQELFGGPSTLPWALHIDLAHRPAGYEGFATFQPTFLYELVFDLVLAGVLLVLLRSGRVRPPGIFALYVAGYAGFRIFEERLRVDPAHHFLGLRLNFFVAVVLCAAGLLWFAWTQRGRRDVRRGATLLTAGVVAASLGACGHAGRADAAAAAAGPVVSGAAGPAAGSVRTPASEPRARPASTWMSAPGRTRTCDPRLRRPPLYPAELPGRGASVVDAGVPHASALDVADHETGPEAQDGSGDDAYDDRHPVSVPLSSVASGRGSAW
jgi:prolipoprotein diacylglyceryl transferase